MMKFKRLKFCNEILSQIRAYSSSPNFKTGYKNLIIDHHAQVTTITLNRPESRNSLNTEIINELSEALRELESDNETRAIILGGEGGNFCSGFDLKEIKNIGYTRLKSAAESLLRKPLCDKPLICAVSGFTVAEGFELALACDLRVIEDTATLGFLGRRFGAPHSLNGGENLAQLVGASRAMDLTLTGRLINGEIAHQWGLAARLVATGTALGQSLNLAMSLPKFPLSALKIDKLGIANAGLDKNTLDYQRNEMVIQSLIPNIEKDMEDGADKFLQGTGKHGNCKDLTKRELKSWEIEDDDHLPKRIRNDIL